MNLDGMFGGSLVQQWSIDSKEVTCGATAGNGRGIGLGLLAFEA
jgi:hypothetical protein